MKSGGRVPSSLDTCGLYHCSKIELQTRLFVDLNVPTKMKWGISCFNIYQLAQSLEDFWMHLLNDARSCTFLPVIISWSWPGKKRLVDEIYVPGAIYINSSTDWWFTHGMTVVDVVDLCPRRLYIVETVMIALMMLQYHACTDTVIARHHVGKPLNPARFTWSRCWWSSIYKGPAISALSTSQRMSICIHY